MVQLSSTFVKLDVPNFNNAGLAFALYGAVLARPSGKEESTANEIGYVFFFFCGGIFDELPEDSRWDRFLLLGFWVVFLVRFDLLL